MLRTVEAVVGGASRGPLQHLRRPHATAPPAPVRATAGEAARAKTAQLREPVEGRDPSKARTYATSDRFAVGDLVKHATFGLGLVTLLKDVNKIEVVFEDGPKVLLHRRA
jgi:hypothetical protein